MIDKFWEEIRKYSNSLIDNGRERDFSKQVIDQVGIVAGISQAAWEFRGRISAIDGRLFLLSIDLDLLDYDSRIHGHGLARCELELTMLEQELHDMLGIGTDVETLGDTYNQSDETVDSTAYDR